MKSNQKLKWAGSLSILAGSQGTRIGTYVNPIISLDFTSYENLESKNTTSIHPPLL